MDPPETHINIYEIAHFSTIRIRELAKFKGHKLSLWFPDARQRILMAAKRKAFPRSVMR